MKHEDNPDKLTKVDFSSCIPRELLERRHWVAWGRDEDGKKVPYNPRTGGSASVNKPDTWSTAAHADLHVQRNSCAGIGIVLNGDGLVAIDLDGCRNPGTGYIEPWAQAIVDELDSYAEISPSGTGVHIFAAGRMTGTKHKFKAGDYGAERYGKEPHIELYDDRRYLTVTGDVLPGHAVIKQCDLTTLEARLKEGGRDTSESGIEWKLVCQIIEQTGKTDPDEILAIFRKRHPKRVDRDGKSADYLRNTIKNALDRKNKDGGLITRTLDTIKPRKIRWLWENKIPYGYCTVIAGNEGVGKSTLACNVMAKHSRKANRTLLVADEDGLEDLVVPKLMAANTNLSMVEHLVASVIEDGTECRFDLGRDVTRTRQFLKGHNEINLIIVDPWLNYFPTGKSAYKDQDIRHVLMPWQKLAEETGIAVLCVAHFKKGSAERANDKVGGAGALLQIARSGLLVVKTREEGGITYGEMHQTKHNLNPKNEGLNYKLVNHAVTYEGETFNVPKLEWCGKSEKDIEALLASSRTDDRKKDLCAEWLISELEDGKRPAAELLNLAEKKGFSKNTLYRARTVAQVKVEREKNPGGKAWWILP